MESQFQKVEDLGSSTLRPHILSASNPDTLEQMVVDLRLKLNQAGAEAQYFSDGRRLYAVIEVYEKIQTLKQGN